MALEIYKVISNLIPVAPPRSCTSNQWLSILLLASFDLVTNHCLCIASDRIKALFPEICMEQRLPETSITCASAKGIWVNQVFYAPLCQ